MPLELIEEELDGLKLFKPKVFEDERGWFMESWRSDEFDRFGLPTKFVQDNHSLSQEGVLRGLHFQYDPPQGKLIRVISGAAQVVEVDLRVDSDHLGRYASFELNAENKHILWVPPGFANGFLSLIDNTEVVYKVTEFWNPEGENNIFYADPEIGINWHIKNPILSDRDHKALHFSDWLEMDESEKFKL